MGALRKLTRRFGARLRRFGAHPWITAWMRRYGWRLDRRLLHLTGGRFSLNGPDVLLLETTGRRTGLPRETPVIYVRDGEDFVITSEDFGQDRPAGWPLNLAADPEATVTIGRRSIPVRARRLSESEADVHWERLVEACPAHEIYWRRSGSRHVFLLSPVCP